MPDKDKSVGTVRLCPLLQLMAPQSTLHCLSFCTGTKHTLSAQLTQPPASGALCWTLLEG